MSSKGKLIATREDGARLYDIGDGRGRVEDAKGRTLGDPNNLLPCASILARGYWTQVADHSELAPVKE